MNKQMKNNCHSLFKILQGLTVILNKESEGMQSPPTPDYMSLLTSCHSYFTFSHLLPELCEQCFQLLSFYFRLFTQMTPTHSSQFIYSITSSKKPSLTPRFTHVSLLLSYITLHLLLLEYFIRCICGLLFIYFSIFSIKLSIQDKDSIFFSLGLHCLMQSVNEGQTLNKLAE